MRRSIVIAIIVVIIIIIGILFYIMSSPPIEKSVKTLDEYRNEFREKIVRHGFHIGGYNRISREKAGDKAVEIVKDLYRGIGIVNTSVSVEHIYSTSPSGTNTYYITLKTGNDTWMISLNQYKGYPLTILSPSSFKDQVLSSKTCIVDRNIIGKKYLEKKVTMILSRLGYRFLLNNSDIEIKIMSYRFIDNRTLDVGFMFKVYSYGDLAIHMGKFSGRYVWDRIVFDICTDTVYTLTMITELPIYYDMGELGKPEQSISVDQAREIAKEYIRSLIASSGNRLDHIDNISYIGVSWYYVILRGGEPEIVSVGYVFEINATYTVLGKGFLGIPVNKGTQQARYYVVVDIQTGSPSIILRGYVFLNIP